jgi:hypothetical protein
MLVMVTRTERAGYRGGMTARLREADSCRLVPRVVVRAADQGTVVRRRRRAPHLLVAPFLLPEAEGLRRPTSAIGAATLVGDTISRDRPDVKVGQ